MIYCLYIYNQPQDKVIEHNINFISKLPVKTILQFIYEEYENTFKELKSEKYLEYYYMPNEDIDDYYRYNMIYKYINMNNNKTFNNIFFKDKELVLSKLNKFINNEEYYKNKSLNYKLTIMLSGKEGCGKTSFIKAIANYLHYDIQSIDLILMDKIILIDYYNTIYLRSRKRIILIENIDFIIKNIKTDIKISDIINVIDGMIEQQGKIIIIKTKYPEALLKYNFIDINVNLTSCDETIAISIINNIFDSNIQSIKLNKEITPGELTHLCLNSSNVDELIKNI